MSEQRRPHWSDDLLASVMTHCNDIEQCHAVIAAVEDWIDARGSAIDGREVVAAIAAVARVREVCERDSFWLNDTDSFGTSRALTVSQVLKALDSDQ